MNRIQSSHWNNEYDFYKINNGDFAQSNLNPYPMNYNIPTNNSINVSVNGVPMKQTLNMIGGPVMYSSNNSSNIAINRSNGFDSLNNPNYNYNNYIWGTPYPTNHSIPSPYQMRFIAAMSKSR